MFMCVCKARESSVDLVGVGIAAFCARSDKWRIEDRCERVCAESEDEGCGELQPGEEEAPCKREHGPVGRPFPHPIIRGIRAKRKHHTGQNSVYPV